MTPPCLTLSIDLMERQERQTHNRVSIENLELIMEQDQKQKERKEKMERHRSQIARSTESFGKTTSINEESVASQDWLMKHDHARTSICYIDATGDSNPSPTRLHQAEYEEGSFERLNTYRLPSQVSSSLSLKQQQKQEQQLRPPPIIRRSDHHGEDRNYRRLSSVNTSSKSNPSPPIHPLEAGPSSRCLPGIG
jgi:hypothetical protein